MLHKLRSVCILSQQVEQVRANYISITTTELFIQDLNEYVLERFKHQQSNPGAKAISVKRRVGYQDELVETSTSSMKKLRLDDDEDPKAMIDEE